MKEFYITDDGIQLHAKLDMPEEKEKCPLVIVFHGLTGNMEERHITAVSSAMNEIGFATLRVELYGHGKSGGAFEQHNLMKWINNAMTVTDYAKTLDFVTDLYICGHSQGGLLTMLAAGMRADDFKAAIPLSPAIVIPDGARKGNLLGQPFDPEHVPDMLEWGDRHLSGNYIRTAQLLDVTKAINDIKAGKIEYRLDKSNIIHVPVGKASFSEEALAENYKALMDAIMKAKPSALKGQYLKSITLATTMGPGVKVSTAKYC